MKAFYNKYHNFDFILMSSVANDKYKLISYITDISNIEPTVLNFNKYQEQLKFLYEESKKDKWIINKVYDATMELITRSKNTKEFKNRINEIYINADEIFKEVEEK